MIGVSERTKVKIFQSGHSCDLVIRITLREKIKNPAAICNRPVGIGKFIFPASSIIHFPNRLKPDRLLLISGSNQVFIPSKSG